MTRADTEVEVCQRALERALRPYLTPAQAVATYAASYTPEAGLSALPRAEQELRIDMDLYAHIYREECREFHKAFLGSAHARALHAAWQSAREGLIAGNVARLAACEGFGTELAA